ncbi:MAG: oxaloacetate decarboxylase gamma subunit [Psychrosphaera sp.]|jgi:oxaloacetate decarboxylase gamma subunit|uniref:Probable oxaloacetate decarboxylase gamma chain n=1 Tax=Psychrosphaera aquimarina TaxID=2044854 RepID=A0ABU3R2X3_9GAMM|nr:MULTISPECIES: OadG family transporter subunit [Psychrosphaera]MBU2919111.1 OadG family protein [Psychrosphaera sp. F3M07]MDU0114032.1 OadG family transporter subunit [Psychrosphaera aquimarina]
MNVSELLAEAGILMAVGMLVVFLFLSVLIVAIKLLTKFAEAYPDPVKLTRTPINPINSNKTSPQVIAAITAAVKQHKARNK